jgi:hypothetical protein
MADIEKRVNKAAYKVGATWDTEADVNEAGAGITPTNQGAIKLNYPAIEVDEIQGANETDIEHANYAATDFALDFKYNYDGRENSLLGLLFGTAAAPQPLFVVTTANQKIDIKDTSAQTLAATVAAGSYTGAALATAIAAALNTTATITGTYTCTFSTSTLKFTIAETAGPTNFELLWNTGTNKATGISTLCGFSDAADDTGAASYASDSACTGSGAYTHTIEMKDSTSALFGTYAVEKGAKIHVVPSFKPQKMTLSLDGGMIKLSMNNRGTKVIDDSAVVTAMSSVTYPAIHNSTRAKYHQATFWMNGQTGDALDSGDVVKPKSFTIEFDRKLDSEHAAGSATIIEPLENGKPTVKITLEFPRMDTTNDDYFAEWIAETEKKMSLTFTGPVIVGTHTYKLALEFPRLQLEDVEYADAGIIPCKIVLRAVVADAAPTGMTVTKPMTATLINTRSTSLIA